MHYFALLLGLVGLMVGGDILVKGAVALSQRLNLPALLIGIAIVGFGTSLPELLVCVAATFNQQADIAVGSIIGSNIANLLLILGSAAVIYPLATQRRAIIRDGSTLIASSLVFIALATLGSINRVLGLFLFLSLCAYLYYSYVDGQNHPEDNPDPDLETQLLPSTLQCLLYIFAGIGILVLSAKGLVHGATEIARSFGVSEAVIGLTLVALGTSLPELAASIAAGIHKRTDIAVGNALGSSIFNILGMLGITGMLKPFPINPAFLGYDLWIMLCATIIVLTLLATGWQLSRKEGIACLCLYGLYIAVLAFR